MSPRGERWFDKEAGPVVRLYALTRGRGRPAGPALDVVDVVAAVGSAAAHGPWLPPEHRRVLGVCATPIAVADLASDTGLPLGVVQVLLSDLYQQGLVTVARPASEHVRDEGVLRKVLDGLRSLLPAAGAGQAGAGQWSRAFLAGFPQAQLRGVGRAQRSPRQRRVPVGIAPRRACGGPRAPRRVHRHHLGRQLAVRGRS